MGILLYTAALQWAMGQSRSFTTLPHSVRQWVVGLLLYIASPHCNWVVRLLQYTASLHGGSRQWGSFCTLYTA